MVKLKDLQTGKETVVAFEVGPVIPMRLKMRPTGLHPGAGLSHGQHKDRHIWATNGTSVIGITSPIKFDPELAPSSLCGSDDGWGNGRVIRDC